MNISTASNEYLNRPADERYATLSTMRAEAETIQTHSAERTYSYRDLSVVADHGRILLHSPRGVADLSPWAFTQLAQDASAPAGYLKTLPADLTAQCLEHGLQRQRNADDPTLAKILATSTPGQERPTVRAMTSPKYGRVWQSEFLAAVEERFGDGMRTTTGTWQSPPTWEGTRAGQYMGDRDAFVIRIDGGSIVEDPSRRDGSGQMYRAILLRNSDVGAARLTWESILYRYICGNHILWGAVVDETYSRRHIGTEVLADFLQSLDTLARTINDRPASQDETLIRGLMTRELGKDKAEVVAAARRYGATKEDAEAAYTAAEQYEHSPRSVWGYTQGLTRVSQDSPFQDVRFTLDQIAASMLARAAHLVTV